MLLTCSLGDDNDSCDLCHAVADCCRDAIKFYEDNAVSDNDVFAVSVPSTAISAHLNK